MIISAFLILFAAVLWRLLPELRHLDAIEQAWKPEGAEADTLAGVRSASSGAPGVAAPLGAPDG